jgi:hypothetical protein
VDSRHWQVHSVVRARIGDGPCCAKRSFAAVRAGE